MINPLLINHLVIDDELVVEIHTDICYAES